MFIDHHHQWTVKNNSDSFRCVPGSPMSFHMRTAHTLFFVQLLFFWFCKQQTNFLSINSRAMDICWRAQKNVWLSIIIFRMIKYTMDPRIGIFKYRRTAYANCSTNQRHTNFMLVLGQMPDKVQLWCAQFQTTEKWRTQTRCALW